MTTSREQRQANWQSTFLATSAGGMTGGAVRDHAARSAMRPITPEATNAGERRLGASSAGSCFEDGVSHSSPELRCGMGALEVLLISAVEADFSSLRRVLEPLATVRRFATGDEALTSLRRHPTDVVVCSTDLPDESWKDLLAPLACLVPPPMLVVSSRLADEELWVNVLRSGGYDLLPVPFEAAETVRVISEASRRGREPSCQPEPDSEPCAPECERPDLNRPPLALANGRCHNRRL